MEHIERDDVNSDMLFNHCFWLGHVALRVSYIQLLAAIEYILLLYYFCNWTRKKTYSEYIQKVFDLNKNLDKRAKEKVFDWLNITNASTAFDLWIK